MPPNGSWRPWVCAALIAVPGSGCTQDPGVPPNIVEVVGSYRYQVVRDPMNDRILSECVVGVGRALKSAGEAAVPGTDPDPGTVGVSRPRCTPGDEAGLAWHDTVPMLRFRCPDPSRRELTEARAPWERLWDGTRGELEIGLPSRHIVELSVPGRPPIRPDVQIRFGADSARVWPAVLRPVPDGTAYVVSIPTNAAGAFQKEALGTGRIRVRIRGSEGAAHTVEFDNHRLRQALGRLHCGGSS